jgi:hypothetical protein
MSQGAYGFSPEIHQKNHFLFILHMLISRSICDITKLFPITEELLMSKDENLRIEIELLGEICTSKWDTKNLPSDTAE